MSYKLPDRLFPVRWRDEGEEPETGDDLDCYGDPTFVWTVSADPTQPGWETDCATWGYGIPKRLAEEICRRYNAVQGDEKHRSR